MAENALTQLTVMLKPQASVTTRSPWTKQQLEAELIDKGGTNRAGYACIPSIPSDKQPVVPKSETVFFNRQDILAIFIVELPEPSLIERPNIKLDPKLEREVRGR